MGCGTGDITFRIARALPGSKIDAIDGSAAMLRYAEEGLKSVLSLKGGCISFMERYRSMCKRNLTTS
jgi:ubiquinone/menaquinone biosynthesis C-methylase UbiE